jgi:hypothetical protein
MEIVTSAINFSDGEVIKRSRKSTVSASGYAQNPLFSKAASQWDMVKSDIVKRKPHEKY